MDRDLEYAYVAGSPGPVDAEVQLDRVIDHVNAAESRFYFYDDLDRLSVAADLLGASVHGYTYDDAGNLTHKTAPAGATTYTIAPGTDQVAQATGVDAAYYSHDVYGSRIWEGPTAYAGTPSHVFDDRNRLVEVRDPVTFAVLGQYTYDAFGRRVSKTAGATTTVFLHDEGGQLLESRETTAAGTTVRAYLWLESERVGFVEEPPAGSPAFYWTHGDHLDTALAITDTPASDNAKVVWTASYEPYGLATPDEDPDGDSVLVSYEPRFPGQWFDGESGDHYNLNRIYDPTSARYTTTDPIGQRGGWTLYRYALSSPIGFFDPGGLDVVNTSKGVVFVLPEDGPPDGSDIVCVPSGETYPGNQDALAVPGTGVVFKTVDGTNATVDSAGEVATSNVGGGMPDPVGPAVEIALDLLQAVQGGEVDPDEVKDHGTRFEALMNRANGYGAKGPEPCGCP